MFGISVCRVTRSYQVVTEKPHHCHLLQEEPGAAVLGSDVQGGLWVGLWHCRCWEVKRCCMSDIEFQPFPNKGFFLQRSFCCVGMEGTVCSYRGENTIPEAIWRDKWTSAGFTLRKHIQGKLSLLCSLCCPSQAVPKPVYFERKLSHLDPHAPAILRDIINFRYVVGSYHILPPSQCRSTELQPPTGSDKWV